MTTQPQLSGWRTARPAAFAALVVAAAAATGAAALAHVAGGATYATHPAAVSALAISVAAIALIAAGLARAGRRDAAAWLALLAATVAAYPLLAVAAAVAEPTGTGPLAALWHVWWALPLVAVQSAALWLGPGARRVAVVLGLVQTAVVAMLAVAAPAPATGSHPTAAPGSAPPNALADALFPLAGAVMLAVPVALAALAVRARGPARTRIALSSAAAVVSPLLVAVCLGLGAAGDPGRVAPEIGSLAYLVVFGPGCALAAAALAAAARPRPRATGAILWAVSAAIACVVVVLASTWLAAWLGPVSPLLAGTAVAALTAAVVVALRLVPGRLAGSLAASAAADGPRRAAPAPPAPAAPDGIAELSPREREVLSLLADGARDAEIATRLHLSPRTVETHVRRIFTKLGLGAEDGRNRRLVAARIWLDAVAAGRTSGDAPAPGAAARSGAARDMRQGRRIQG